LQIQECLLFQVVLSNSWKLDSSVGTLNMLWAEGPRFDPRQGQEFIIAQRSNLEVNQPDIQVVKQPACELGHSVERYVFTVPNIVME
jgi:hypothetical protein